MRTRFHPLCLSALLAAPAFAGAAEALPVFPEHATVLFQGDSITDGGRGRGDDPNHFFAQSYALLIAARCGAAAPERHYTFLDRGISGNTVGDLARRWKVDALDLRPTVLSILIGVNDLNGNVSAADFRTQYAALLEQTRTALPGVKLVLCEPFGLPTGRKKDGWDAYHARLAERQAIVAELARQYDAALVHLQKVFDDALARAPAEYWVWDGVHPTFCGHQLIADEWMRVVGEAMK